MGLNPKDISVNYPKAHLYSLTVQLLSTLQKNKLPNLKYLVFIDFNTKSLFANAEKLRVRFDLRGFPNHWCHHCEFGLQRLSVLKDILRCLQYFVSTDLFEYMNEVNLLISIHGNLEA